MTLVDAHSYWIEGYFEETQLAHITIGARATAVLLGFPGQTLIGHVSGVRRGITVLDAAAGVQGLPSVNPVFTWVRLAQRVPVRMEIDQFPPEILLSAGMTATVSIDDEAANEARSEMRLDHATAGITMTNRCCDPRVEPRARHRSLDERQLGAVSGRLPGALRRDHLRNGTR